MSSPNSPSSRAAVGGLAVWLLPQLGALALAAGQIPLSRGFPQPEETLAAQEMIVVQIAISAMLFPMLLHNWRSTLLIIAASAPMLQLAGFLSGQRVSIMLGAMAFVAAWLVGLALWRWVLVSRRAQLIGSAVATALALGGPALWYLRAEAAGDGRIDWARESLAGPAMSGLALLASGPQLPGPWILVAALLATALAALGVRFLSRQVINRLCTTPSIAA